MTYEINVPSIEVLSQQSLTAYQAIIAIAAFSEKPFSPSFCRTLSQLRDQQYPSLPLFIVIPPVENGQLRLYWQSGITDCIFWSQLERLSATLQSYTGDCSPEIFSTSLNHFVQEFWQFSNLDDRLQQSLNLLHQSLALSRCFLLLPDEQQNLKIHYVSAQTPYQPIWFELPGIPSHSYPDSLEAGKYLVISEGEEQVASPIYPATQDACLQAGILMPLYYQNSSFGAISLHCCDQIRHWSPEEVNLAKTIAQQCAIAIYQNHLEEKLYFQQNCLKLREKISEILRISSPLETHIQKIITTIGESLDLERVLWFTLEQSEVWAEYEWRCDDTIPTVYNSRFPSLPFQSVLALDRQDQTPPYFLQTNYPKFCNNYPYFQCEQKKYKTYSILSIPIGFQNTLYGSLVLQTVTRPYTFHPVVIQKLQDIADTLAHYITRVKNQENIKKLEQEYQHKSALLSTMSHELRTPLTGILGFARMLLEQIYGELNDKQTQYMSAIVSSGEHLLHLVNDLLDISKIEAQREELYIEPFAVEELCVSCLSIVEELARLQDLELKLEIDDKIKTCVADQRRIKQILINLLSNAIKFTQAGTIALKVYQTPEQICYAVIDTGIGIAPEHLDDLFQPFQQIKNPLQRKHKGTGLGLALSQKLARLHGGDLTVTSTPGEGSCFTLCLPINNKQ
ncbi:GAF domain-containing sensor histidine kinase [Spirulina sp. CS-785/01]|nr:GAF domain-containing sensor histidine kinase [Spirulina sp. CS-785/01]